MNDLLQSSPMPPHSSTLGETLAKARLALGETNLRDRFITKPITLHRTYQTKSQPMLWPKVIRDAYATMWSRKYTRVIIKAPRGGGKSKLLGTLGFDEWFLRDQKVVNMGGSLAQADIVYGYFQDYCDIDASIVNHVKGGAAGIKRGETESVDGVTFNCVAASAKSVRGKHPDILLSDETCETADELIYAALPMVNDSKQPLVVMASTFHKIYGIFQETWDNAIERGYVRIQWDIFDVAEPFEPNVWEHADICNIAGIQKLKTYAHGRTGDPEGWVPIANIIQAWREKPTEDWFEVEYLGNRPSAAGLVLKPEDVDRSVFDSVLESRYNYAQGATCVIGIDWGFSSMTAVTEWMGYKDEVVVMLDNTNYHQTSSEDIVAAVVARVKAKGIRFIYADSAGKFENDALRNALKKENIGCSVIEVVFSKEKEEMLGNLRAHFEQGKVKIPKKFREAYWQYKRYRYQEGTDKPVKKDDHVPDSTMCAWQHFKLGRVVRRIPLQTDEEETTAPKNITAGLRTKQF